MEPEQNKVYQVFFGNTWGSDASQSNLHTLQYNFVKQSVDWTKQGVISRASNTNNGFVSVEFKNAKGEHAAYLEGSFAAPKKPECILVFDGEKFIIEKIGTTALGLVDTRRDPNDTKRPRPEPTAADIDQLPPVSKRAKDAATAAANSQKQQASPPAPVPPPASSGVKIKFPTKAAGKASASAPVAPVEQIPAPSAVPVPAPVTQAAHTTNNHNTSTSVAPPQQSPAGGSVTSPTSRRTRTSLAASSSSLAAAAGASEPSLDDSELLALEQQMTSELGSSSIIAPVPEGAMRSVFDDESSSDSDESEEDSDDSDDD